MSHPDSWSDPNGGSESGSGRETIYWDSLLTFLDIGGPKSCNRIKILYTKLQNKTTTVVVFTLSYTYNFESHLHIQNYTLHLHDQSTEPTVMNPTRVLARQNVEDNCLLLLYLHGLKNPC